MQVKTTNTEQIWQSPDGARSIWEVTLKADDGHEYRLKTYSPKVSQLGFSGEVESYQNPRGDRFVRQKPHATAASSTPAGSYHRDDNAIKAQWAIGQAINLASVKMDKKDITMPVIENYAKELFATVGRVKGEPVDSNQQAEADKYIETFSQTAPAF
jgi:hypothetical protein